MSLEPPPVCQRMHREQNVSGLRALQLFPAPLSVRLDCAEGAGFGGLDRWGRLDLRFASPLDWFQTFQEAALGRGQILLKYRFNPSPETGGFVASRVVCVLSPAMRLPSRPPTIWRTHRCDATCLAVSMAHRSTKPAGARRIRIFLVNGDGTIGGVPQSVKSLPFIDSASICRRYHRRGPWTKPQIISIVKELHNSIRHLHGDSIPFDSMLALRMCGYRVVMVPQIISIVKELHNSIRHLHGDSIPFDSMLALRMCGYRVVMVPSLGISLCEGGRSEVAAEFDGPNRIVKISKSFPQEIQAFTAAHELAHAVLHPEMRLHRDRPVDGERNLSRRSPVERIADLFAVNFTMPEERVLAEFVDRFLEKPFILDEARAFALYAENLYDIRRKWSSLRSACWELSQANYFNGVHFLSLAERFGVSKTAMAIRLEELRLVGGFR